MINFSMVTNVCNLTFTWISGSVLAAHTTEWGNIRMEGDVTMCVVGTLDV